MGGSDGGRDVSRPPPRVLHWDDAHEHLSKAIAAPVPEAFPTRIIAITGPVGAGKSTLAQRLASNVLTTDAYLPDYSIVPYLERDDPAHADLVLLAANLSELRAGRPAEVPVWSFFTHRRESMRTVHLDSVIAVEGLFALHALVRPHIDVAVFVEAPSAIRWPRLEQREQAGERGWPLDHLREHFRDVAEPWFDRHAAEYRAAADFVVVND